MRGKSTNTLLLLAIFTTLFLITTCGEDITTSPQETEKLWCDNAEMICLGYPLNEKLHYFLENIRLSPDETKIAYSLSTGKGSVREIWIVNSDGTEPKLFYQAPESIEYPEIDVATWSPDMQYIAFCMGGYYGERKLYYISVDGGEPIEIPTPPDIIPQYPDWSPDGEWISFYHADYYKSDIYKIRIDGTDFTRLTNCGYNAGAHGPRWSPDGVWIVFSYHDNMVVDLDIYKIPSYGGEPIRLTDTPNYWVKHPCWSPDGEWVAYSKELIYGLPGWEPNDIWITRADGSMESYQISNSLPDGEQPYDIFGDYCSSWGREIGILFWNTERDWKYNSLGTQIFKIDPKEGWDFQRVKLINP